MRHLPPRAMFGLIFALGAQAACAPPVRQTSAGAAPFQTTPTPDAAEDSDAGMERQINAFAEGEGNETILRDFKTRPQDSLIASIKRIRDHAEPTDPIRVKIAFLFCRLGYSYSENRAIVVEAFTNPRQYEGFYKDDGVGMLAALIREGDKDLLPVTFRAATRADGALAEGLSDIFIKNVREDPNAFLRQLSHMSAGVRRDVYKLVGYAILTDDDSDKVRALFSSVPLGSEEYAVAKEMLRFLDNEARRKT
jgi:hypothetical protein